METLHQFPDAATIPVHRLADLGWRERHEAYVGQTIRGGYRVAFIGDSITEGWESTGRQAWDAHFAPIPSANFGIGGDGTYNLLWRFANGEVRGYQPDVFVLLIGTNNIGWGICDGQQTAAGIVAVVQALSDIAPVARVLLHEILPRAEHPDDPMRTEVELANRLVREYGFGPNVSLMDNSHLFLRPDGTIPVELMPDFLHLTPEAYDMWAESLRPHILGAL